MKNFLQKGVDIGSDPCYDEAIERDSSPEQKNERSTAMPTKDEILVVQKSTVYDINKLIKKGGKDSYTPAEIEAMLDAYIEGAES